MPRKGHSEEQIVYALRQVEGARRSAKFVERWEYRRRRFTAGSHNLARPTSDNPNSLASVLNGVVQTLSYRFVRLF